MTVPSEADWRSAEWQPDTRWAYERFFGLDTLAARAVIARDEQHCACYEDLLSMPPPVFAYYLRTYCSYLLSDDAAEDCHGASVFIAIIDSRSRDAVDELLTLWQDVEPVLRRLAEEQDFFDADWPTYGSFRSRIGDISRRGFPVSFNVDCPEVVPEWVTVSDMAASPRAIPVELAAQVFRNSGIDFPTRAARDDVEALFGVPDAAGGGPMDYGVAIPPWMRYERPGVWLRFALEGIEVREVWFMGPAWR